MVNYLDKNVYNTLNEHFMMLQVSFCFSLFLVYKNLITENYSV
jgi:hypothetical protein